MANWRPSIMNGKCRIAKCTPNNSWPKALQFCLDTWCPSNSKEDIPKIHFTRRIIRPFSFKRLNTAFKLSRSMCSFFEELAMRVSSRYTLLNQCLAEQNPWDFGMSVLHFKAKRHAKKFPEAKGCDDSI